MSSWTDPQNILFFGSAFLVTFLVAVRELVFWCFQCLIGSMKFCSTQIFICLKAVTTPHPIIKRHKEEEYFFDPNTKENEKFPSIHSSPTIDFTIVVPAYDEEKRCQCWLILDFCIIEMWQFISVSLFHYYSAINAGRGNWFSGEKELHVRSHCG